MKKIIVLVAVVVTTVSSYAQNITDAVRFSQSSVTGTARFAGVGGAFGALGGDLSAISVNPAGSAVFTRSSYGATLSLDSQDNSAVYFGNGTTLSESDVAFTQAGGAFVYNARDDRNWIRFVFAVNYDRTQDFNDNFIAQGIGNTSIGNYFTDYAQGVPLNLVQLQDGETVGDLYQFLGETEGFGAQQALLGFQSFIIDPTDFDNPNGTSYISNIAGNSFNQDYNFASAGYNGKLAFNGAAQYRDNLYIGVNVNSHFFDYEQSTFLVETNDNPLSLVREVRFENNLRSLGAGLSFQVGAIGKIDNLRLGFTYDSPTWFTISEEGSQRLETVVVDGGDTFIETVNPRIINIYQDYRLKTPGQLQGSIAYLFGKDGLISFDYGITDWTQLQFRPKGDPIFSAENNVISNALTTAATYRLGGEYRVREWSLRGGYRLQESPYEDGVTIGDLTGVSLGIGYNFGNTKLDIAWDQTTQDRLQSLYTVGLTSPAAIERVNTSIIASLTFSL